MTENSATISWSINDSAKLYKIRRWGKRHFAIGPLGTVVVKGDDANGRQWDLAEIVEECESRGISAPILCRFTPVIHSRVRKLHGVFAKAIGEYNYTGKYQSIYPIKVNQHREVIDAYLGAASEFGGGLEAGSRAELLAVIAMADNEMPVLCNGFKDAAIIEMAMRATQIGRRVTIIIDKPQDVPLIIEAAASLNIRPLLGIRVKLAARSAGRWKGSVGNESKFGLTSVELAIAIQKLHDAGLHDSLHLLHFHPGSQVNSIRNIKSCVVEATRIYAELVHRGVPLDTIDVGGGLAIDYTGDKNSQASSMNYTTQEYANDIVYYMKQICDREEVPHPNIYSESGRAMVAHHSVLVVPVISTWSPASRYDDEDLVESVVNEPVLEEGELEPLPLIELRQILAEVNENNASEAFHDAQQAIEMAQQLFINGHMALDQRTFAEDLFSRVCLRIQSMLDELSFVPDDLKTLKNLFAETYLANFSVFQALPDHWAIDQLFPIMPIHRLDECPDRVGIIGDITCDSDGRIACYLGDNRPARSMALHKHFPGQKYWLGIFLIGAYQEALSDDHNLFGKFHVVTIDDSRDWRIGLKTAIGSDLREVLEHVHHDVRQMMEQVESVARHATSAGRVTLEQAQQTINFFKSSINDYTYLLGSHPQNQAVATSSAGVADRAARPVVSAT